MDKRLEILYQDDYIVAINKPSGLLVHRTELDPKEQEFAVQLLRNQLGQYVFPIHRLDKPTSGVLLFSLNLEMAQNLSQSVSDKQFHKEYLAITRGWMPEDIDVDRGVRQEKSKERKEAFTKFHCLEKVECPYKIGPYRSSRYSLVKATPLTGRRHQIRKHLNHLSHPIVGDTWYGDRDHNRFFEQNLKISQMLLHSEALTFIHPQSKIVLKIQAPLPEHWKLALSHLNLNYSL